MQHPNPVLMIHGYNHDPKVKINDAFPVWEEMLEGWECIRHPWFSAVQGRGSDVWKAFKAWVRNPYGLLPNTYTWAYSRLAPEAAKKILPFDGAKYDIIAHSLGTRVALLAVAENPHWFRRVMLLNGAETSSEAIRLMAMAPEVEFINVAVEDDDILRKMGAVMSPKVGYDPCIGNGMDVVPENCLQVVLDDPDDPIHTRFHDLEGDNPDSWGDHFWSFMCQKNWPLLTWWFQH